MSSKKLSIIIVNYRSESLLIHCLASIYNKIFLGDEIEIIVVNNDQQEDLRHAASLYPNIKIAHNLNNRGFGAGINFGTKNASGKILFFLNPDTEILSENISEIIRFFDEDSELGVLGGRLVKEDGQTQEWGAGQEINLVNLIWNNLNRKHAKKNWGKNEPEDVAWVSGTALFVRRDVFEKINGFDEKFFMYFEDVDLCKRVKEGNKKILYYPDFLIKHLGGKCYPKKDQQKRDYYRSQKYYFKKNRNFIEWQFIRIFQKIFF